MEENIKPAEPAAGEAPKGLPVAAPVTGWCRSTAKSRRSARVVRFMANNGKPIVLGRNAAKRAKRGI